MKKLLLLLLIFPIFINSQVTLLMPNDGFWYTYTTDDAILYDDGGLNDYANDGLGALTIYPISGVVTADVGFFDVEFNSTCGWDVFEVYNGDDFSNLIGSYCGTTIPSRFESTHPTGALTFFWSSDGSVAFPGFEIRIGNFISSLPIELISFTAEHFGSDINPVVVIEWSVASQVNNDYYEIKRSIDVEDWKIVATIEGAGNSNTQMSYQVVDDSPILGTSYYMLSQTDYDGTTEEFLPISLIITPQKKELVKIFNIFGQEVTTEHKGMLIKLYRDGSVEKTLNNGRFN